MASGGAVPYQASGEAYYGAIDETHVRACFVAYAPPVLNRKVPAKASASVRVIDEKGEIESGAEHPCQIRQVTRHRHATSAWGGEKGEEKAARSNPARE